VASGPGCPKVEKDTFRPCTETAACPVTSSGAFTRSAGRSRLFGMVWVTELRWTATAWYGPAWFAGWGRVLRKIQGAWALAQGYQVDDTAEEIIGTDLHLEHLVRIERR